MWEFTQMPFYTVWARGSVGEIAFDALHCTASDVLVAASTLGLALSCSARGKQGSIASGALPC